MSEPRAEIGKLWFQVSRGIHDRMRSAFREYPLPPMALIFLRHIKHQPGVTVSELSRLAGTAKSHVSKLIDQLVGQAYLQKRPDPDDQRLVRLYLTPAADQVMSEMEQRVQSVWAEVTAELPESEAATALQGLRVLLKALGDREDDSAC